MPTLALNVVNAARILTLQSPPSLEKLSPEVIQEAVTQLIEKLDDTILERVYGSAVDSESESSVRKIRELRESVTDVRDPWKRGVFRDPVLDMVDDS